MHLRIFLTVLLCSLLWGSAFPGIKYVYAIWDSELGGESRRQMESLSTRFLFAGVRFTIAGLLVFLYLAFKNPGALSRLRKSDLRLLALFTVLQTVGQYVFFYWAMSVSSGVLGSLLVAAGSFWWILLAPIILGSPPPTAKHIAILILCAAGIFLAVNAPGAGAGNPVLGAALFLSASLCGAIGIIVLQPLSKSVDISSATAFSLFTGGLILTFFGLPAIGESAALADPRIAGMTLYLAFVSAAAFTIWNGLSKQHPVNILAGYRFLIPLCGVILSALFVKDESPGPGIYIGGSIVIFGIILLARLTPTPTRPVR